MKTKHHRKKVRVIVTFKLDGRIYKAGEVYYINQNVYSDFWLSITDEGHTFFARVPEIHFCHV